MPKYVGQEGDDWLKYLGEYLVERFAGVDSENTDVRKVINKDFEFERVMELSRTS